jgi:hypothetical protein
MGSACGGYVGWPGLSTAGADAKVTEEISVSGTPLQSGLWTYYVNYNNVGGQSMKSVSTYRDGTAPFGVFTSDGNLEQHFDDHVGVITSNATDTNGDGTIGFDDYNLLAAFCPDEGGTGSSSQSGGFKAYCSKGDWAALISGFYTEETKSSSPGSKYSNSLGGGSNFSPITLAQILASSTPLNNGTNGLKVTINAYSLNGGQSWTPLSAAVQANVYGLGHAIAIDATQSGLKELASDLASSWMGKADGSCPVYLQFNNGAAADYVNVACGQDAATVLQHFASN